MAVRGDVLAGACDLRLFPEHDLLHRSGTETE